MPSLIAILVPSDALSPPPPNAKKRSLPAPEIVERTDDWTYDYLNIGDTPWYCFWNATVNEFWVFLDQDMDNGSNTSTATATITSGSSLITEYSSSTATSPTSPMHATSATSMDPAITTPPPSAPPSAPQSAPPSTPTDNGYWSAPKLKRQATNAGSSDFPKLAKMVEKRKPHNNIQPYCQQMQVLNNWQIVAIPDVPTICIEESEYNPAASTGGNKIRRGPDTVQQLGSNCICEWFSDGR